ISNGGHLVFKTVRGKEMFEKLEQAEQAAEAAVKQAETDIQTETSEVQAEVASIEQRIADLKTRTVAVQTQADANASSINKANAEVLTATQTITNIDKTVNSETV